MHEAIKVVELHGGFKAMGRDFGERFGDNIREFTEKRIDLTLSKCRQGLKRDDLLFLSGEFVAVQERVLPEVHEEFEGIAQGAGLRLEELMIGNGFTDFRDLAKAVFPPQECTTFLVKQEAAPAGVLAGQTWDMSSSAEPYVVLVKRKPDKGPATIAVTTMGCLSLIGMNEHGICIGNNNLTPNDPRSGLMYLAAIHNVLGQSDWGRAVEFIKHAPLASGHHYYIGAPGNRLASVERTGAHAVELGIRDAIAHTNHYLAPDLLLYENRLKAEPDKSVGRLQRAEELLAAHKGDIDVEVFKTLLQDTADAPCRICIDFDDNGTKTCAAAVFDIENRTVHALQGPPNQSEFAVFGF